MMSYTADNITQIVSSADTVNDIDWLQLRQVVHQVYHPSCFERYAKRNKSTGVALTIVVDDHKHLVRRLYVDGWCVWVVSSMWIDDPEASKLLPVWATAPFGTFPDL